MAGIENSIVFSNGERLEGSTAADITGMQAHSTDVSRINHTGNPEGVISANPSSLCHDPVSGILYLKSSGTGNTGWIQIGGQIITIFDTPGMHTWDKNPLTKSLLVIGYGAGGGGGSGRKGSDTMSSGGSGGGAGGFLFFNSLATCFGSSESVVIGAGGAGGAAQTSNDTDGNIGSDGSVNTSFGTNLIAIAGEGGLGGTDSQIAPSNSRRNLNNLFVTNPTNSGGNGDIVEGGAGFNIGQSNSSSSQPGGGGGGAGADVTEERLGGIGASQLNNVGVINSGGAGGLESTGINGSDGNDALSNGEMFTGGTGGGGGGGYSVGAMGVTAGGTGGNGGNPGGGGGGGGGGISVVANSGAGGNGGDGLLIVIEYF